MVIDENGILSDVQPSDLKKDGIFVFPKNKTVKEIGERAFEDVNKILTEISIPDSVEKIRKAAFLSCYVLKKVRFSQSLKSIGIKAFSQCLKLENAILPESLSKLGTNAFERCYALKEVYLPDKLTVIKSGTFAGCRALNNIRLPQKLTFIGKSAFWSCDISGSLSFPDTLRGIGETAFDSNERLEYIKIPASTASIEALAFSRCSEKLVIEFENSYCMVNGPLSNAMCTFIVEGNKYRYIPYEMRTTDTRTVIEGIIVNEIIEPNPDTKLYCGRTIKKSFVPGFCANANTPKAYCVKKSDVGVDHYNYFDELKNAMQQVRDYMGK